MFKASGCCNVRCMEAYAKRGMPVKPNIIEVPQDIEDFLLDDNELTERALVAPGVTGSNIGAIGVFLVCADLLQKGFDVYPTFTTNAVVDVLAVLGHDTYRIEVKGSRYIRHNEPMCFAERHPYVVDVFAAVDLANWAVHYWPALLNPVPKSFFQLNDRKTIIAQMRDAWEIEPKTHVKLRKKKGKHV